MSNAPTHLTPKPFLALEDARIAIDAASTALTSTRVELANLERRAANLLLSDQDVRELVADFSVNELAMELFHAEHEGSYLDWPEAVRAEWSRLNRTSHEQRMRLRALGDVFQRTREEMAARVRAEAQRGAAA